MYGWGSSMWNMASRDEMARGWKRETAGVERVEGGWIIVPITEIGWGIWGSSMRGRRGVMGAGSMLAAGEVGNRDLSAAGVLDTCIFFLMRRLRRGICGMKSFA